MNEEEILEWIRVPPTTSDFVHTHWQYHVTVLLHSFDKRLQELERLAEGQAKAFNPADLIG